MLMAISHGPVFVFYYQLCIQHGYNHVLEAFFSALTGPYVPVS